MGSFVSVVVVLRLLHQECENYPWEPDWSTLWPLEIINWFEPKASWGYGPKLFHTLHHNLPPPVLLVLSGFLSDIISTFIWGLEEDLTCGQLRGPLCPTPVLAYPNYDEDFPLYTDASGIGLGVPIMQTDCEGSLLVPFLSPAVFCERLRENAPPRTNELWL